MNFILNVVLDFNKISDWGSTFVEGTIVTVVLALLTVVIGSLIGLLAVIMKQARFAPFRWLVNAYTQIVRGTPLLLQLFMWLYGLPILGISISSIPWLGDIYGSREFLTAVVALSINSGAYICELLRGGLESIDKGQMEAGRSLGLSRGQTMRSVIIPQAIRVVLPGLGNEFIMMIKESAIVSVVGVFDVMYTYNIVKASTYSIFEPLIVVGVIYFMLTATLTFFMNRLEKRLHVYD
ncbi:His/Glu/Gln/Arg/opine family amino acid ABC transporter permease subunit [Enterococcus sp. PF1-24]|uniref:amino acid ABC transporter permease n=1 Tax=unclassified Enterococcus TaxID=2608891 RepID=UPI002474EFE8|nr:MULTISPECIES: amino acid ABC transporter permease [unclassified Enterococcus]MDH6365619.1 His/Glu/Gln/Arg/opine family amino acid ABC transporter permease subunit [Enterococcus sp. PFB1-1]MDH6402734.1 His/Glu/Gln/Arg/opine family amino acid ABC transporter permease subunit [Enterococcus sp. PF1-24]